MFSASTSHLRSTSLSFTHVPRALGPSSEAQGEAALYAPEGGDACSLGFPWMLRSFGASFWASLGEPLSNYREYRIAARMSAMDRIL